jgi:hypothetical protein
MSSKNTDSISLIHTVTRNPTLYTSSRVTNGRYNALSAIAGGIVYFRCLDTAVSLVTHDPECDTYTKAYSKPIARSVVLSHARAVQSPATERVNQNTGTR